MLGSGRVICFLDDQRQNHDQITLLKRPSAKSRDLMHVDVCVCWGGGGGGGGVYPKIHNIYHPQTLHPQQPCITNTRCVSLSEAVT